MVNHDQVRKSALSDNKGDPLAEHSDREPEISGPSTSNEGSFDFQVEEECREEVDWEGENEQDTPLNSQCEEVPGSGNRAYTLNSTILL